MYVVVWRLRCFARSKPVRESPGKREAVLVAEAATTQMRPKRYTALLVTKSRARKERQLLLRHYLRHLDQ